VLDSGCTNHMTGEKEMFTSFEENDCSSDTVTFGDNSEGNYLGMIKSLALPIILFLKFCLLIRWTTICCSSDNFVRWATIVCSLTKV
jgi:hypothetical protein